MASSCAGIADRLRAITMRRPLRPSHRSLAFSKPTAARAAASASACRARCHQGPASCRTPTRPGSTDGRSIAILRRGSACPIRCANDANCFALSEAADGAAAGASMVFGVILGTGCGGGLVHHGRIIDGPRGIGGEWGHNPLPWAEADEHPGPACWCGRSGCMETWVSGPAIAADHVRAHRREPHGRGDRAPCQSGECGSAGDARSPRLAPRARTGSHGQRRSIRI